MTKNATTASLTFLGLVAFFASCGREPYNCVTDESKQAAIEARVDGGRPPSRYKECGSMLCAEDGFYYGICDYHAKAPVGTCEVGCYHDWEEYEDPGC
jgi:hypothetical protein